ncbi:MAG TPA: OB-fold nucleic acid binding domain-containing protein [Candidatus Nanoarchaeia archaeon]|nr:OB-fold nucleic acid binding domain-containing protein [Candidatus Nanoarchaeia archaeon]
MTEQFLRQTAYKLWISDIIIAPFTQTQEQMTPNFITTRNLQISRVNIIGITTNIQKQENYSSIILDDSTAQINIRTWNEDTKLLDNILPGQIVIVIGKIRYFNNQIYLSPEIIKNTTKEWLKIRHLELKLKYKEPILKEKILEKSDDAIIINIENITPTSKREIILKLIEKLDDKQGADINEVIENSKLIEQEAEKIIKELIKEGEIFEIKSGRLRTIT